MNETALSTIENNSLALDSKVLENLESYDDFLSYYIQIDQTSSAFSWLKADLLFKMTQKLGDNSVKKLAEDIKQPVSTIVNYTRTAMAFPPEKREEGASFSIHFQASFADSLDEKSREFDGNKRFEWLEKAVDNNMSTRKLAEEIQLQKSGVPEIQDAESAKMFQEAQSAVMEIKKHVDNLYKDVRRNNDKDAYFEIIKIHQSLNV
jgi:hypothetical protein